MSKSHNFQQGTITQFGVSVSDYSADQSRLNTGSASEVSRSTPLQASDTYLTCDAIVEVYKFGHSKQSGSRNTLVALHESHKDLHSLKSDLRKNYGLLTDAKRWQIGDFNIEIGICDNRDGASNAGKTYIASSQMEWENLRTKVYSGMWQCTLLVRLLEIQYRCNRLTKDPTSKLGKVLRGPYKRDERVVKDEELLKKLRAYTGDIGRVEDFTFERLTEQQQLFEKFKKGKK